jgi:hypothetical protein
MDEQDQKIAQLFMPYGMARMSDIKSKNTPFVHYTSAYAAMQIIEKEEVWMRNALVMNDFMEVQHGQNCLSESWKDDEVGGRLRRLLERLQPGLSEVTAVAFDEKSDERSTQSYLISVSEHGGEDNQENRYGRLSMWRAYGGDTNVAFVFKNKPFMSESTALNAFTSPVLYRDVEGFKVEFLKLIEGLENEAELLTAMGPERVSLTLNWAFHFAALSTKHPGFAEEREWRVILSPTMGGAKNIDFSVETIQGVPQKVYKLKLKNYPDQGFVGATLPELLEEIIVGPTANPFPIYEALALKLEEKGVQDAWSKVRISDIPLRR